MILKKKYDTCVFGYWNGYNYGSLLTYYALKSLLNSLGKSVSFVKFNPSFKHLSDENTHLELQKELFSNYDVLSLDGHECLCLLNNFVDTFILGSDQLWAPYHFRKHKKLFFLDFAKNDKRKIAIATSFGKEQIEVSSFEKIQLKHFFKRFQAISLREKSAVSLLKSFGKDGVHILDPVFLCDFKDYENLISNSGENLFKDSVVAYILDPDNKKRELILKIKDKLNSNYLCILDYPEARFEECKNRINLENVKGTMSACDYLNYFKHSKYIVTDSFHGTCFAILFKKPFVAIANKGRGYTRFESILSSLDLEDRLFYDINEAINSSKVFEEIDYDEVYKKLNKLKIDSINWIKEALNSKVEKIKYDFNDFIYFLLTFYKNFPIGLFLQYYKYKMLIKFDNKNEKFQYKMKQYKNRTDAIKSYKEQK